jgi:hypothetical protein
MAAAWYYVQGSERKGPVGLQELADLVDAGVLNSESYVWRKGFSNWERLKKVDELASLGQGEAQKIEAIPVLSSGEAKGSARRVDLGTIGEDERVLSIKVGHDRGGDEVEYGPFSIKELRRAYAEKRINGKTFVFSPGMEHWKFLAELPVFRRITNDMPPVIEDKDRRVNVRKPFVTRLFFHDNSEFFEGICRDISVGGMQILVSNFPAKLGESIRMNVHPDNSDYCFVASGTIVRILEGGQGFSIRFGELEDEAIQSISTYIERN